MNQIDDVPTDDLEACIERYEAARAEHSTATIEAFLPPAEHPQYAEIAAELIRVDLEYCWIQEQPRHLEWYRARLPGVFENIELLAGIAFEEYRLRLQAGEAVSAADYERDYGVDVSRWPAESDSDGFERDITSIPSSDVRGEESLSVSIPWSHGERKRTPRVPAPLAPGSRCCGFEIDRELGRGASARVYLARQHSLANRQVVLKVSTARTVEPERLARLQHANVVPLFSYHRREGLHVMCMPYLGPHMLDDWVARLRTLEKPPASTDDFVTTFTRQFDSSGLEVASPEVAGKARATNERPFLQESACRTGTSELAPSWERLRRAPYEQSVLWLATEVARGLAHAHDQGILHLDLKPGNILLTDDGRPMLLDFHLAASVPDGTAIEQVAGGTLPYMSPEQLEAFRGRAQVDARSDVYSLGVVLFELLTGKLPFPARKAEQRTEAGSECERRRTDELLGRMIADRVQPPSVRAGNPGLAAGTAAIVQRCLNHDPGRRYQTAHELIEDLERQCHDRPLRYAPNPLAERFRKWYRRHPRLTSAGSVSAIAAVAIVVAGVAGFSILRQSSQLEAEQKYQELTRRAPEAKAALFLATLPARPPLLAEPAPTIELGRKVIELFGADSHDDWTTAVSFRILSPAKQRELRQNIGQLLFQLAATGSVSAGSGDAAARGMNEDSDEQRARLEQCLIWSRRACSCLQGGPGALQAMRQQVNLLRRLGRVAEADSIEEDAAQSFNASSSDPKWLALQSALDEEFRGAVGMLEVILREFPKDFVDWFVAGNCYFEMRDFAEAETCFTVCATMDPGHLATRVIRVQCRLYQQRWNAALEDCDSILAIDGGNAVTWFNRGLAMAGQSRWRDAISSLERARLCGFPGTRVHFLKADYHSRLGDLAASRAEQELGFADRPTDDAGWAVRGHARMETDPQGAIEDFHTALRLNPRCYDAARDEAHVLADRLGDVPAALNVLDRLLQMTARDPLAWSGRAVLHARLGNAVAARSDIEQALALPRQPAVLYQAACVEALLPVPRRADLLSMLAESVMADSDFAKLAVTDSDLDSLRELPEFTRLLEAAATLHRIRIGHEDSRSQLTE